MRSSGKVERLAVGSDLAASEHCVERTLDADHEPRVIGLRVGCHHVLADRVERHLGNTRERGTPFGNRARRIREAEREKIYNEYFERVGLTSDRLCVAHCVWVDEAERRLAELQSGPRQREIDEANAWNARTRG